MDVGPVTTEAPIAATAARPAQSDSVRARETSLAIRNGLKMGASLVFTWSVALIVKLDVPAHLGPVRQGHFGFAESFAAMFFAVLGLGIDTHLVKECAVRPQHASDVVGGVFALRAAMSVGIFIAMATVLWATGRSTEVLLTVMLFGLSNVLMVTNGTLGGLLQAISHVGPAAVANVATKIVWGASLLVALHYNAPLPVLALPGLAAEGLRTLIVAPATSRAMGLHYRIDIPAVRAAIVESTPYFVNGLALGILSNLAMSTLEFVRHDEREVGWFAADQNVAGLCMLLSPVLAWVMMPLLSRAHARSEEEGMAVFRRWLEGIVVTIVPITVLISAGSDVWVRLAFGAKYAQASTGLSILSFVFIMMYMNILLSTNLIIMRRGWSVTVISIGAVFVTALLMILFVPLGRHFLHEGGECAGAAAAVIGSEACTLIGMLTRFRSFPLDARNLRVIGKSLGVGLVVFVVDHQLRSLGIARFVVGGALYVVLAFAFGVVRFHEIGHVIHLVRARRVT